MSLEVNNILPDKRYPGWKEYFKQFKALLRRADFVDQVERVGLRYVNVFHEDRFFEKLNVKLKTGWEEKGQNDSSTITFFVEKNGLKSKVTIATEATIQDPSGARTGQVIDIDTFIEGGVPMEDLNIRIDEAHTLTEEIFYSLLSDELMKQMGPNY